jgi:hypothetical protein
MNWFLRVLTWDGLLPAAVWAVPAILMNVLPNGEPIVLLLGVLLPIVALLVRFYVGRAMIAANRCGPVFRKLQVACLGVGLFILMCLDSLLITLFTLQLDGADRPEDDWRVQLVIFAMFYGPYLAFLAVAMYPGRTARPAVPVPGQDDWSFSAPSPRQRR